MTSLRNFFDQAATNLSTRILVADCQKEWGSQNPQHRTKIREAILEYLKQNHPDEADASILDLDTAPTLPNLFVSISHCLNMGGFVIGSTCVGFDIENTSRLSAKIVERVSTPEERAAVPYHEILWPAKEAIYKCENRFKTVSQIILTQWDLVQHETYRFRIDEFEGWSQKELDFTYALAIKKS